MSIRPTGTTTGDDNSMDNNQSNYDALDVQALSSLLLNADMSPEVHRGALSALARRSPYQRSTLIIQILRSVMSHPDRYDQEVMMALIDILGSDPNADATAAMLEVLPDMLEQALDPKRALKPEFREYFYQTLVTRQREDDLSVWGEMLPNLEAKTLVAILVDPVARPLEALEPLTLIDRLREPSRTKALISVIAGVAHTGGDPANVQKAAALIANSADADQLKEGINVLGQHWDRAKKSGRRAQTEMLERALSIIDPAPRTPTERLTGKRMWAK